MANFGLNKLLALSVPLLTVIYPVALVLILLGFTHDFVGYSRLSYKASAFFAVCLPLVSVAKSTFNLSLPLLTKLEASLPMASNGLSWALPSLAAVVLVEAYSRLVSPSKAKVKAENYM